VRSSGAPKSARRTTRRAEPRVTNSGPAGRRGRAIWLAVGAAGLLLVLILGFVAWARAAGPGKGTRRLFDVHGALDASELADALEQQGLTRGSTAIALYLRLTGAKPVPGRHLLRDDLSPRDLVQRLTRSPARPHARVTIPEGYNFQQIAERLSTLEVCDAADFAHAVFSTELVQELRLRGPSSEGFLFPATYELAVDSDPAQVVRALVAETRKRLARLEARHPGAFDALARSDGFDEHDVVTLASMVEREAADPTEQPLIASVFYNRLRDASFRPLKMLESDPTAAYGCLVEPAVAPTCADYHGQVTPALLRDPRNPYNTYRHPGLPPGPIANPGEGALSAVLAPAPSDYLYFVASGHGHHTFSRTFEEHKHVMGH